MINSINNIPADISTNFDSIQNRSSDRKDSSSPYTAERTKKREPDKAVELTNNPKVNYNELADALREVLKESNLDIEFTLDEATKKMIMKLIDSKTKEVVQQYPPEVSLQIARIVASTMEQKNITNVKV